MSVIIGSARISENGSIYGAKGDTKQKGTPDYSGEVSMEKFYQHSLGWTCLRAKSKTVASKLAKAMAAMCNNKSFGYSQPQRLTGYNEAAKVGFDPAKVKTPCNIDCSEAVRTCLAYAGIKVADFTTHNEINVIMATGKFDKITKVAASMLEPGDILCTKKRGHTVIVISTDQKTEQKTEPATGLNKSIIRYGVINCKSANVRMWAGKENKMCSFSPLMRRTTVGVCDTVKAANGDPWYYINYKGKYGFIAAKYVS